MGFDSIIGHDRAKKLLQSMLDAGRLPHALLISGPGGVGKRSMALALAQTVNCTGPDRERPCGVCSACMKTIRGSHPDVEEIQPDGKARIINVDVIRTLRTRISYRPYEGRMKVFILREANRMQETAANALLKTLEEPPPESLLILTSPEESDLLPTIVSRCVRLNLAPLNRQVIEDWLKTERGLTGPVASLMAAMSGGCLGRVEEMAPDSLWEQRRQVVERLASLDPQKPAAALEWAGELAGADGRWPEAISMMRFWFRDLMILSGGGSERHLVNVDMVRQLKHIAAGRRPKDFIAAMAEIDRAEDALTRFVRPDLVFENMVLALTDIGRGIHE